MLSDEEREALQYFNTETKTEAMHYGAVLVKLIEKQSKEIEGLKEDNKKKSIVIIEYQDLYEKLEDKIKAKIEEIDKEEKEQLKGTKGQDRYAIKQEYMHKRSVLQSLLEKE